MIAIKLATIGMVIRTMKTLVLTAITIAIKKLKYLNKKTHYNMNANYQMFLKPMKILDLSLKYHWYDEIASGRKKEEYREIKHFYKKRLMDACTTKELFCAGRTCNECKNRMGTQPWCCPIKYDAIRFHRGQGSPTTMLIEFKELRFGYGKTEWGAPDDHEIFIIKLGKIIKQND